MTNFHKAADVIDSVLPAGSHIAKSFGDSAAQALTDAGLLAPELPKPDLRSDDPDHQRRFAEEWGDDQPAPDVWFLPGGGEVQTFPGHREIQLDLVTEAEEPIALVEARALALALLAAVEKHEQA